MKTVKLLVVMALLAWGPRAFAGFTVSTYTTDQFTGGDTKDVNYAYVPSAPTTHNGQPVLLLFFAGSGATLNGYTNFMERAANKGYYVVGLAVRNDFSHTMLCSCMPGCMGFLLQSMART
jgi:hypothetical protein